MGALRASLPKKPSEHEAWARSVGFPPEEYPFEWVQRGWPPSFPRRVILSCVIPAGTKERRFVITEPNRWSVQQSCHGLYGFVYMRALEYARWRGMTHNTGLAHLALRSLQVAHPGPYWRQAKWGIGYEHGSGLCTLLLMDDHATEELFLEDRIGYATPTFP